MDTNIEPYTPQAIMQEGSNQVLLPLFDKIPSNEMLTKRAKELDDEIQQLLTPVFQKARAEGYSMREVHLVALGAVNELVLDFLLNLR